MPAMFTLAIGAMLSILAGLAADAGIQNRPRSAGTRVAFPRISADPILEKAGGGLSRQGKPGPAPP